MTKKLSENKFWNQTKICLIRPPSVTSKYDLSISIPPPIGLAYLAAAAKSQGFKVSVVDAIGEDPGRMEEGERGLLYYGLSIDECVSKIDEEADIIGITIMFSLQWPLTKILIKKIRERHNDALIIIGGEHATALSEFSMKDAPEIDVCVMGEGENVLIDIAKSVENKESFENIPGIALRKKNEIIFTKRQERIKDLKSISWPDWTVIPIRNYHSHLLARLTYGVVGGINMPIMASRGCPYKCAFCSNATMWENRWLVREPDDVIDEMKYYMDEYGATDFSFYDLTAIVKKEWIIAFCNKLVERGMDKITWQLPTGTRSEALDVEVCRALYTTGCKYLVYAPESASERILISINKKIDLNKLVASMRSAISVGITVRFNIIIGFPSETRSDIWKTLKFIVLMARDGATDSFIGIYSPYPGSELYDQLRKDNVISSQLNDDYFHSLTFTNPFGSPSVRCNKKISILELIFYRTLGYLLFYSMTYIFKPSRILMTFKNIKEGNTESAFENALTKLFQMTGLTRLIKKGGSPPEVGGGHNI